MKKMVRNIWKARADKKYQEGYVYIKVGMQWIAEHRLVAEDVLNRPLKKEETIHHINFQKDDNRATNLALFENQKSHIKFHLKYSQFGVTQPLINEINIRRIKKLNLPL